MVDPAHGEGELMSPDAYALNEEVKKLMAQRGARLIELEKRVAELEAEIARRDEEDYNRMAERPQ